MPVRANRGVRDDPSLFDAASIARGEGAGVVNSQLWLYCLAIAGLIFSVMVIMVLDGRRQP